MARIAVDMDEVMADTLSEYLARYNAEFGTDLTRNELMGKRLAEAIPEEHWPSIYMYFEDETFFEDLPVMDGCEEVLRTLSEKHELFVVTAAMEVPASFGAKFRWLQKHFSFIPKNHYVFCGTKGIIAADYLIDDSVYQLEEFTGTGLLYSAPRNCNETKYRRVDNWLDVKAYFDAA